MGALAAVLRLLERVNSAALAFGRSLTWVCVAIMVVVILVQVFFRYVLNAPLAWTEELARVFMIWMTAFAAPSAYRWAGFVSIDMLRDSLPAIPRRIFMIALLVAALLVLLILVDQSLAFFERGFRTTLASIWYPVFGTGEDGGWGIVKYEKFSRAWVYLAMPVLFIAMTVVNVEMLLREVGRLLGREEDFPEPPRPMIVEAE
jgi:TRAP-type C4-dicarboxylate transport system permease small subunit